MTELDDMLRGSFARIAEPGDPAGVAAAIQSRVDSGDTGTPADSSGFGGGSWLPWLGVIVIAGLVGGGIGVSGAVGRPAVEVAQLSYSAMLDERVDVLDCPGGSPVGTLLQGERVLAVARSDDGAHLAVRDPYNSSQTIWIPRAALVVDDGEQDAESLPIDDCDRAVITTPTPTQTEEPQPGPAPGPGPKPAPQPPADSTAPVVGQSSATPNPIYAFQSTVVHASAADNVGVASMSISWSGEFTGSGQMTKSGSEWVFTFTPTANDDGLITFTIRAVDAAGNQSAPATVVVDHRYFG